MHPRQAFAILLEQGVPESEASLCVNLDPAWHEVSRGKQASG
jgi:hypothetical protein